RRAPGRHNRLRRGLASSIHTRCPKFWFPARLGAPSLICNGWPTRLAAANVRHSIMSRGAVLIKGKVLCRFTEGRAGQCKGGTVVHGTPFLNQNQHAAHSLAP